MERRERIFHRVSQRGTVSLIVREQYLRNDIPCLATPCTICQQVPILSAETPDLPVARLSNDSPMLLPDTKTLVDYMELFETPEFKNIIFNQTSLNQILHNESQKLYQRIRAVTSDPRKQAAVFCNENFASTFTPRLKDESPAERDFRAIHRVAQYYQEHLKDPAPILLISSLENPPAVKKSDGVVVLSMEEFIARHWKASPAIVELFESVKEGIARSELQKEEKTLLGANDFGFTEHLEEEVLEAGVKSGILFKGRLNVSSQNAQDEATVITSSDHGTVLISGTGDRNRAVHGDVVVIEMLPESRWKAPIRLLRKQNEAGDSRSSAAADPRGTAVPTGRVVGILQRNWRPYVATLQEGDQLSGHVLAIPMDFKVPKIRIRINEISRLRNQRLVVRIDSWAVNSQYPAGHFVRSLGECNQIETEVTAILVEHEIQVPPFSEAVLNSLPKDTTEEPWRVTDADLKERRDLRKSHFICSIDPLGSEDIDDALSVRLLPNGNYELGVHIADVTHFVQPESPCDVEGKARGTSVYLADRRFNMLPTILSERLCSLRGEVDRFAVSVLSELTPKGDIVKHWFGKTMIRSAKEMFYEQAQTILDEEPETHEHLKMLDKAFLKRAREELPRLAFIANVLREKRLGDGGLELESAEIRFNFDQNKGIAGIVAKTQKEIHKIVAECMIFANAAVGTQIAKIFPSCALLRKHPQPQQSKFNSLIKCVEAKGYHLETSSNKALAESLDAIGEKCDPEVMKLLRTMATVVMSEAEYFSTGTCPVDDFYHYGLALEYYTHFTSPIRRYADCIVHWQLIASVQMEMGQKIDQRLKNTVLRPSWVEEVSDHLNQKNRNAKLAQGDSTELFECLYIMNQPAGDKALEMTGIIYDIRANGFMVFIPKLGLKTVLYLKDKSGSIILSPRFMGEKNGASTSVPVAGSLATTESTATLSLATGGSFAFRLFDKLKLALSLSPSHAHLPTVLVDMIGREAEVAPTKTLGSKSEKPQAVKAEAENSGDKKPLSKKDLMKAIESAEQAKKGLEVVPSVEDSSFQQTPESKSMYAILEKMRILSL